MPSPTRAQLVLVEVAAAAVLGGLALSSDDGGDHGPAWVVAGIVVALVLVPLALLPFRRRWLFQVLASWWGLRRRRRAARRDAAGGPAGVLGEHRVDTVPGGRQGSDLGVVRSGTTWSLPLVLGLDDVLNQDAAVPLDLLTGLLQVEDVPLSSVRLLTLTTPGRRTAGTPEGPSAPMVQLAARYLLLTLDTRRAAEAVASRGGSEDAVRQILRRCAVHADQVLSTAGVRVGRLDENAVAALFGTWMGPASPPGRRGHAAAESWSDVLVGGTWSSIVAVTGRGDDVVSRVQRLAAAAPTPVAATSLVLRPGRRGRVEATMLVRLSAPDADPPRGAVPSLQLLARAYDLTLQRADGEQAPLLRATTPVGVGEAG